MSFVTLTVELGADGKRALAEFLERVQSYQEHYRGPALPEVRINDGSERGISDEYSRTSLGPRATSHRD